jgi:Phage integrase family
MARMRPPAVPEQPVPVLGDDALRALLATAKGNRFENRRDEAITRLLADTGMRASELIGLSVADVDQELSVAFVMDKCSATCKSTGQRCRRRVIAAAVCHVHGQNANVKANREARLAKWKAAQRGGPLEKRDPAGQLLAAAREADVITQRLCRQMDERETLDAANLEAFGQWLYRVGRLSRSVLDARIDERRTRLAEVLS